MARIDKNGLAIDKKLHDFLVQEAIPGTGVDAERFFSQFAQMVHELAPKNRALLAKRDEMQEKLDAWYRENGAPSDPSAYETFLREIDYLLPEGPAFSVSTDNVDPEIAEIAGPQLVVPVMIARYALNAANARWGSLYDALYGTDAIPETDGAEKGRGYNPVRGAKVIAWARSFLDQSVPLSGTSWSDVTGLVVTSGRLTAAGPEGRTAELADPSQFVGYTGEPSQPRSLILRRNNLHIQVLIDPSTAIGKDDPARISDVRLESAITTIMDCEDSVAAVDAEDKVLVYGNWLGLMKGDLQEEVSKGGRTFVRKLEPDLAFTAADGSAASLKGRSLMLVRNVGHLMTNPAILDQEGREVPEGIMDAMVTGLIALHDIGENGRRQNSRRGSMYVVKPKMHGPEEVAFACEIFARVEEALGMPANTIKMGIMDEERRTTVNLKECIRAARERVVFGRPIGANQGVAHPLAEAWAKLEAADALMMRAAALYDAGLPCGPQANAAKYMAAEASFAACEAAVLTLGGMGYAKEYDVERLFRESMIGRIAPVSRQMILNFISEKVLDLPRSY